MKKEIPILKQVTTIPTFSSDTTFNTEIANLSGITLFYFFSRTLAMQASGMGRSGLQVCESIPICGELLKKW